MDGLLTMVTPGQTERAHTGLELTVPLLGQIVQTVDLANHSLTNTTLPGHQFYPGSVKLQMKVNADNKMILEVTGSGNGSGAFINVILADSMWGRRAQALALYVFTHNND